jgi:quinolinate synthase
MNSQAYTDISRLRAQFGDRLTIFGHHYMSSEVIRHADFAGDSLELSRRVPGLTSEYIVFCGVSFMAESAAILASSRQKVFIPDTAASCVMSDMAPHVPVQTVLERLRAGGRKIIPLAYVNTSAAVKAICGRFGGSVCTSANASTMLSWALKQGDGVLFLPDRNLAMNTANALGMAEDQRMILDIRGEGKELDQASLSRVQLFIWPGLCVIHHRFKTQQIARARAKTPDALIVVHPECSPEVVAAADASGSTSFIIDYVRKAPAGATIYIGTECNLVERLAVQYKGEKTILALVESACVNMAKITEPKLAKLLFDIDAGRANEVTVPPDVAAPARDALTRMLEVCCR